ncbi:MAG: ATP-dependent helicase HrpB, partial [Marinilabilia sp.]
MFHVKKFDAATINLPVAEIISDIKAHLIKENTLIVHAPPGAGKSTLLPLALMHEPWLEGKKIIMLEPRRLAARSIAARMASLLGEEVGQTVGYRIRFDNKVSKQTRIEVVTEGILTRKLQNDNALEDTGLVIFDEFHERSLFADTALVLSRESQQVLRPDLRIMVMSATLDMPKLSSVLEASVLESEGKQYPVKIEHTGIRDLKNLPHTTARIINQAVKNDEGDILAFLPGEAEIRKCEELLQNLPAEISIHPLCGQLSPGQQTEAIMPHPHGKRKVVLATSIAETSLTIEGVSVVVDSGFTRTLRFDPSTGLSRLTTVEITKDAADQRTGRAGRLGPGKCYRLWSPADENRMKAHRVSEIEESDLSSMMLDMALWGISDVYAFNWITPPPKSHVDQAMELLHQLGALENNKISSHGREMAKIPCHPRIAHMLLTAREKKLLPLAADLAAVLEERDPLPRDAGIDINLRVEELRRLRKEKRENGPWKRISKVAL